MDNQDKIDCDYFMKQFRKLDVFRNEGAMPEYCVTVSATGAITYTIIAPNDERSVAENPQSE